MAGLSCSLNLPGELTLGVLIFQVASMMEQWMEGYGFLFWKGVTCTIFMPCTLLKNLVIRTAFTAGRHIPLERGYRL